MSNKSKDNRKLFVIDTSVLLYDKNAMFNMEGNDIVIPLVVLEEIDKFKSREGLLGEYARFINRFLDELREEGSLNEGVYYEKSDINIKVSSDSCWAGLEGLDRNYNDNVIIANANYYKKHHKKIGKHDYEKYSKITVITKDINLRVKCDAVGIPAGDYYADYEFIQEDNLFQGHVELIVDPDIINRAYSGNHLKIESDLSELEDFHLSENEFVALKSNNGNSQSCLMMRKDKNLIILESKQELLKQSGIEAKNKEQIYALELLLDENIPLVTLTGIPGSGKTYLALMTALKFIERESKKRIIFTRPMETVGKDIGFLPGTVNEKMAPWLAPIVDNFRNQFGDLTYFDMMMERGQIDVAPLSHIRGRSFNDSVIIVDEAQNATVHELKTIITRTGKNSKVVLLGDIEQVDLPYVSKFSNGLTIVIEKLKEESLTGHINFKKGYRSELANIVAGKL
jgi:PhoH-like ATPase